MQALIPTICLLLAGCVTRVQVCTTYDRHLGREYGRDNAGASVCADVEPPQ